MFKHFHCPTKIPTRRLHVACTSHLITNNQHQASARRILNSCCNQARSLDLEALVLQQPPLKPGLHLSRSALRRTYQGETAFIWHTDLQCARWRVPSAIHTRIPLRSHLNPSQPPISISPAYQGLLLSHKLPRPPQSSVSSHWQPPSTISCIRPHRLIRPILAKLASYQKAAPPPLAPYSLLALQARLVRFNLRIFPLED